MSNPVGTSLPVATTADEWPVIVMGMGGDPRQREKNSPDGRATYASGGILLVEREGEASANKSASVHVLDPSPLKMGQIYRAVGKVWCQPYEANQRVALSITVERLLPVGGESK